MGYQCDMEQNRIKNFVENIPIYDGWNLLDVVSVSHKSTRIAFSPDFLLNNRLLLPIKDSKQPFNPNLSASNI